jgi:signal transduction histidine kinase
MFELEVGDLPGALAQMAHDAANGMPVKIETAVHGTPAPLPGAMENHLLRIGQEAMTNALKHADAKSIRFDLRYEPDAVELTVADDGRGFDGANQPPGEAGHFGLLGMRERANKLGGTFNLTSQPGRGTTVVVRAPRPKQNSPKDAA